MMAYTVKVLALLSCIIVTISCMKPTDIRNHLGTRTPYRFKCNKNESRIEFPNCKDIKIWMIVRHGTRLPSSKDIKGMNALRELKYKILMQHQLKKGKLTKDQLQRLEVWTSDIDPNREKYLTREGKEEMILLAERMQNRFPILMKQNYDFKTFLFRYTATERAQQSARSFALGLFNVTEAKDVVFLPATKVDNVLRFYKHCDRWLKQVKKNPHTYKEQKLYGQSREMNDTLQRISQKLGLSSTLSLDEVNLMYKICGFETSMNKHDLSPWCYGFDEDTIQTLEYYHDLKHYWMDGYGHELTYRQACLAIKNMFENFKNEDGPKSSFLFAHSGTLLKILTHLELYKPSAPLMGDAINRDNPFKTSNIDCFASNLAFILFKCNDGLHILTMHQERVIQLPMCDQPLCSLERLEQYFHNTIYHCDYTEMCDVNKSNV